MRKIWRDAWALTEYEPWWVRLWQVPLLLLVLWMHSHQPKEDEDGE